MATQRKILTAGLLLLVLSGCTMAPEYLRPALPVAESITDADDSLIQSSKGEQELKEIPELGWRKVFTDPDLQQLIETAFNNNRDLRETVLNVKAYQGQFQIQRAALLPSISGEGNGAKQRTLTGADHSTSEVYSLAIGTTAYELDFYGRIQNLKDKALEHQSVCLSLLREDCRRSVMWRKLRKKYM